MNIALDWLCLNLPEHRYIRYVTTHLGYMTMNGICMMNRLPKRFSSRAAGFEVVLNQGRADVLTDILGTGRMALPLHICEAAIDKVLRYHCTCVCCCMINR